MNDANRTVGRRLRRAVAVPAGVVAALILFFLCTAGAAEAVSAEKLCVWKHKTDWADSLDETESSTYGAASCNGVAVSAACHVIITMGPYYNFGDNTRQGYCNTRASVPVRRSMVRNYASEFSFALRLDNKRRRWTQGFVGKSRPSDGCHLEFVQGHHTLMCTNVHPR